jgi:hypothetical protein
MLTTLIVALFLVSPLQTAKSPSNIPPAGGAIGHGEQAHKPPETGANQTDADQSGAQHNAVIIQTKDWQDSQNRAAEKRRKEDRDALIDRRNSRFSALLVLAAFLQLVVIAVQCWILRRQTGILDRQTNITRNIERGWMLIDRVDSFHTQFQNRRYDSTIFYLKNFGKTPAKLMNLRYELQIGDSVDRPPEAAIFNEETDRLDGRMLPPGKEIPINVRPKDWLISGEDKAAIESGRKFIWLCGYIRYFDVYGGGPYRTNFCETYMPKPMTGEPRFAAAGPDEYNQAT